MNSNSDSFEDDNEEENDEPQPVSNTDRILALIHRMKCDGAVFETNNDIPDTQPMRDIGGLRGHTMFDSRGKFGRS